MRIVSGKFRGFTLKSVTGSSTRPTSDRLRESLFNIIFNKVQDSLVLDLFAGTGALGIEAISRGAAGAVFVDNNIQSVKIIDENINHVKVKHLAEVYKTDYSIALEKLHTKSRYFDIIFIDPPYSKNLGVDSVIKLSKFNILKDDGIIVVESDLHDEIPDTIGIFSCYDKRIYGRTKVNFFKKVE